jgi:hypothetical protein
MLSSHLTLHGRSVRYSTGQVMSYTGDRVEYEISRLLGVGAKKMLIGYCYGLEPQKQIAMGG